MGTEVIAYRMGYRTLEDGAVIGVRGVLLTGWYDKAGYHCFRAGHTMNVPTHRLVAYQKFGDALLEPGIETRHLDGNQRNNRPENIAIGTHSENMLDVEPSARLASSQAASNVVRALTDEEVRELRRLRAEGARYSDLMLRFGICKASVSYVVNKRTYSRVPD